MIPRWAGFIPAATWLIYGFVRYGFWGALPGLFYVGLAFLFWFAAERLRRPLRSYCFAALAALALDSFILGLQVSGEGLTVTALLFVAALTALLFGWAWFWERTEPLPSDG